MTAHPHHNASAMCRALADPIRIRILNQLRHKRAMTALDIATTFCLHRGDLQRHMKYLEKAHLVSCRRIGQHRQYRFTEESSPFLHKLVDFLASVEDLPEINPVSDVDANAAGSA